MQENYLDRLREVRDLINILFLLHVIVSIIILFSGEIGTIKIIVNTSVLTLIVALVNVHFIIVQRKASQND